MQLNDPSLFRKAALIGGEWVSRTDMEVHDPSCGAVLGTVTGPWQAGRRCLNLRARICCCDGMMILQHEADLALILTSEQGKPLAEAVGEVRYGASFIRWFAEETWRINGKIIPSALAPEPIRISAR